MTRSVDVLVIGAGQAGFAAGYYLRRTDLRWAILDPEVPDAERAAIDDERSTRAGSTTLRARGWP